MSTCIVKPALQERKLISGPESLELAELFQILANDTRLRLLHSLAKADELCVTDLGNRLKMKPQAVSNQLQRLVDKKILGTRRDGNRIYYRIVDPCVPQLLELGLCLLEDVENS